MKILHLNVLLLQRIKVDYTVFLTKRSEEGQLKAIWEGGWVNHQGFNLII